LTGLYERKSVAIAYNFIEKIPKVLPSFFEDKEEIKLIQADHLNNQINFIIAGINSADCRFFIKPYSNLIGSKRRMELIGKEREIRKKTFKDARVYPSEANKNIVLGTYSLNCSQSYQGIFAARFDHENQENVSFHKFTDFGNFFNHYNGKRAERLGKKVDKKNTQGKDYYLNYKLKLQNNLIESPQEIIMGMESYYAQYQNINPQIPQALSATTFTNRMGVWNRNPFLNNQSRLYRFTYAVFCGFDKKGKLLWDNVMRIEDVEQEELDDLVRVGTHGDSLILTYLKDDMIYSKLIYRYQTIRKEKMQTIQEIMPDKKLHESSESEFYHWYGNHFILLGKQRLKNSSEGDNAGARVFHLSKISYQSLPEILTKREQRLQARQEKRDSKIRAKKDKQDKERRQKATQKSKNKAKP
jgi:hypothetical protein